jgi:hypothetical protein
MTNYIEDEFRRSVDALPPYQGNGAKRLLPSAPQLTESSTQPPEQRYDFVHLGEKIAESMVRAVEDQLTEVTNMLEQTKVFAQDMQQKITTKARELAETNERLKAYAETILEAHKQFHGEEIK